jgi:hypothetical protein
VSLLVSDYRRLAEQSHLDTFGSSPQAGTVLLVSVAQQQLIYLPAGDGCECYPVSTAANGVGCSDGSGCTPYGWHEIAEKIGANEDYGTVFQGRVPNGTIATDLQSARNDDLITSRILWLRGLQVGVNLGAAVDSFERYIYIHGTAQEHLIGTAVSHGCVRMKNKDVIALFERTRIGDRVLILAD